MNGNLDLNAARKKLEERRADLQQQLQELDDLRGERGGNPDRADLAKTYDQMQRQSMLEDRLKEQLQEVEQALGRIENGTYGRCQNCGKQISPERLAIVPEATTCMECGG